ncbi:hypothetical protein D3C75_885720 [compost metagenome]
MDVYPSAAVPVRCIAETYPNPQMAAAAGGAAARSRSRTAVRRAWNECCSANRGRDANSLSRNECGFADPAAQALYFRHLCIFCSGHYLCQSTGAAAEPNAPYLERQPLSCACAAGLEHQLPALHLICGGFRPPACGDAAAQPAVRAVVCSSCSSPGRRSRSSNREAGMEYGPGDHRLAGQPAVRWRRIA